MLRTNEGRLVKWSVQGKVHHPLGGNYRITQEGVPMILPSTGGFLIMFLLAILHLGG